MSDRSPIALLYAAFSAQAEHDPDGAIGAWRAAFDELDPQTLALADLREHQQGATRLTKALRLSNLDPGEAIDALVDFRRKLAFAYDSAKQIEAPFTAAIAETMQRMLRRQGWEERKRMMESAVADRETYGAVSDGRLIAMIHATKTLGGEDVLGFTEVGDAFDLCRKQLFRWKTQSGVAPAMLTSIERELTRAFLWLCAARGDALGAERHRSAVETLYLDPDEAAAEALLEADRHLLHARVAANASGALFCTASEVMELLQRVRARANQAPGPIAAPHLAAAHRAVAYFFASKADISDDDVAETKRQLEMIEQLGAVDPALAIYTVRAMRDLVTAQARLPDGPAAPVRAALRQLVERGGVLDHPRTAIEVARTYPEWVRFLADRHKFRQAREACAEMDETLARYRGHSRFEFERARAVAHIIYAGADEVRQRQLDASKLNEDLERLSEIAGAFPEESGFIDLQANLRTAIARSIAGDTRNETTHHGSDAVKWFDD